MGAKAKTQRREPPAALSIEVFPEHHPTIAPHLFMDPARAAFAAHHSSPAAVELRRNAASELATIAFADADPRTAASMERPRIVEHGAIVVAGVLLHHFHGKRITRVVPRGDHVDYFVGSDDDDGSGILEVSGTDEKSIEVVRAKKHTQLRDSPLRKAPHSKPGFVSVTRFAPTSVAVLDAVPEER